MNLPAAEQHRADIRPPSDHDQVSTRTWGRRAVIAIAMDPQGFWSSLLCHELTIPTLMTQTSVLQKSWGPIDLSASLIVVYKQDQRTRKLEQENFKLST